MNSNNTLQILPSPNNSYARVGTSQRTYIVTADSCTCGRPNCRHIPAFTAHLAANPPQPVRILDAAQLESAIDALYGKRR